MKNQNTTTAPRRMLDKDIMKTITSVIKNSVIALTLIYPMLLAHAEPELYFVHSDHLNTPQMLTDQNGNVVWQVESQTPFGVVDTNEDVDGDGQAIEFNLRFPGQYYDGETGLSYNYFRDYDPLLGRYIQSDPIGLSGGINTYGYAQQNPLLYIDFFGLASGQYGRSCAAPGGSCDDNNGSEQFEQCWNVCFNIFNPTASVWAASTALLIGSEIAGKAPGPGAPVIGKICSRGGGVLAAWGAGTGTGCGLSCGLNPQNY